MIALTHRPAAGRYLLIQAAVLLGVFVVLAVTPAPVTFPDGPWEIILLLKGAAALLLTNILLIGIVRRHEEKDRITAQSMDKETALKWRRINHYEVMAAEGVIGVVDDVLATRDGTPTAIVISDGWFGRRRFLVPLDELRSIDTDERTITIQDRRSPD